MRRLFFICCLICLGLYGNAQDKIRKAVLKQHIAFLTADSLQGRFPGTPQDSIVQNYIVGQLKTAGYQPILQTFRFKTKNDLAKISTANILGILAGKHPVLKKQVIILGAHYDHLGIKNGKIYPGADDNASGVSVLLEIAKRLKQEDVNLKRSILFIAFGAEEQGLKGSDFFVNNPLVPLNTIQVMLNMDMLGRLNTQKHLYINGAGTFRKGNKMLRKLAKNYDVKLVIHVGSVGGSDHVSFYKKEISVLGLHTGAHEQYHLPTDSKSLLNYNGLQMLSNYMYQVVVHLANTKQNLEFIAQD